MGRLALCSLAVLATAFAPGGAVARGAVVDGISDQNLAEWDGNWATTPFASYFRSAWVDAAHISFARFVVPWDMLEDRAAEPYARYYRSFEDWYAAAGELGLQRVVAFGSFDGSTPGPARYAAAVAQLLAAYPAPYIEAWNEPNALPYLAPARAARYMDEAYSYCAAHGCTAIAGDLLDVQIPGASLTPFSYASQYKAELDPALSPFMNDWGLHPYEAVNGTGTEAAAIRARLLAGERLWITEVGAYFCEQGEGPLAPAAAEERQRARAERLVRTVAPTLRPAHVFYYELAYKDDELTPCGNYSDTALFAPPDDRPRPAASVIFGATPAQPMPEPSDRARGDEPNVFVLAAERPDPPGELAWYRPA